MSLFVSEIFMARLSAVGGLLILFVIVGILIVALLAYEVFRSHKQHNEILQRRSDDASKSKT